MTKNNPSIEDLLSRSTEKDDRLSRGFKMRQTMSEVNRKYEELQSAQTAVALGYEYINLYGFPVDLEALSLIPREDALKAKVIAFHHESGEVRVGAVDPGSQGANDIRAVLEKQKYKIRLYLISKDSFEDALEHYKRIVKIKQLDLEHIKFDSQLLNEEAEKFDLWRRQGQWSTFTMDATEGLSQIIASALKLDSSDIHLEPEQKQAKVRFRVDGVLQDVADLPVAVYKKIIDRIKIIAKLKLNVTSVPQDGSFSITLDGKEIDFRISLLPAVYGEGLVMRILRQTTPLTFDELGITGLARRRLDEALTRTTGLVLTTGPTGSGKTTTLYAVLSILNKPGVKIITIEDPVEYKVEGISQTPIDKAKGMTFASGLRAILRQDPDVMMVGEVRDQETAEVAVQAALTGHVVLTTLHTNDSISAIPRLIDLNIKPFLIVSAVSIGMAQRLVRKICQACRQPDKPDPKLMEKVERTLASIPKSANINLPKDLTFYSSPGCDKCHNLGYKGRVGIFEVFTITPGMEKLILRQAPATELKKQAIDDGMVTMAQDGLLKVLEGITDVYEVFRVTD